MSVVELKRLPISNRQGCDHKPHARKQFSRAPFNLGNNPAWFYPTLCLIGEVGIMALNIIGGATPAALEEMSYAPFQNLVGFQPDGKPKSLASR